MNSILWIVFSALVVGGEPPPWVSLTRLAEERNRADDLAGSERIYREALRVGEEKLDPADQQIPALLSNLALALHYEGRDTEAEPLSRRAFLLAEQSGDQRLIGLMLNCLGVVLAGEGETARAEPLLRRSVAILEQAEGEDALEVAKAANNLSTLYSDTHQYQKSEQQLTRALPIYEKHLGPQHPDYAMALSNMFTVLYQQHRVKEGEPYLRRALAIGEKAFPQSLNMANLEHCMAALEASRENYKEAARLLEKIIAIQERLLGKEHPLLGRTLMNYSEVLRRLHQKSEAKQALNRANLILKTFH
jgi:tetratricopeptide (TPR) repeat protein